MLESIAKLFSQI